MTKEELIQSYENRVEHLNNALSGIGEISSSKRDRINLTLYCFEKFITELKEIK